MTILLLILLLLTPLAASAEDITYIDDKGKQILNLDNIDYYIYKGKRITFSGLINAIVDERKNRFIGELMKTIGK